MFANREIIYIYDGTFDGFLCAAFESFTRKEIPADILDRKETQAELFEYLTIISDIKKSGRVKKSVLNKMGYEAFRMLENAMLTCLEHKELKMLEFMRLGFKAGPKVTKILNNPAVFDITKAIRQMIGEARRFLGFIRFGAYEGVLIAEINPKNRVLEHIAPHFAHRMSGERFIIFDRTHHLICAYAKGRYIITDAYNIEMPRADGQELLYRGLWKMFYDNIAVEERVNPLRRMTFLPKRYRRDMTEFQTGTEIKSANIINEKKAEPASPPGKKQ